MTAFVGWWKWHFTEKLWGCKLIWFGHVYYGLANVQLSHVDATKGWKMRGRAILMWDEVVIEGALVVLELLIDIALGQIKMDKITPYSLPLLILGLRLKLSWLAISFWVPVTCILF